ncbi:thioredoxin domain-containing protein [Pseudanabaena sp. FACHB-2040]|uniref:thioredoxin family protein n=1 Tax=Pseudanabaena sp. FACHB-2040 TaxID=2692859 RepID=UPI001687F837|nr:thioredoxin domain-containing protein [Pseudanabaena sp. FACHB-2040]MBD0266761.1 thioredoxin [Cyanobacteria bacterium Co-bin8]MBD2256236.1 thioredoxin [Pseudanabaena sp. FACHB-2040]
MSLSVNEQTFKREVLDSSVPVLVHFWAPWCGLCKMIAPLLNHFQSEWEGHILLVDINADENLRLANQFRLTTLPTLLFFENGEAFQRLDSFRGKDDLRQALDAFMRSRELQTYQAKGSWIHPYQEV